MQTTCSGENKTSVKDWVQAQIKEEENEKYLIDGKDFIDDEKINNLLDANQNPSKEKIREILKKAFDIKLLSDEDTACLLNVTDPELKEEVFETAKQIKNDSRPIKIKMIRPEVIWDEFEKKQKILNNEIELSNNAMIAWEEDKKGS